eukprot:CAMPEP_0172446792 /NCGR_PEP_ID=MMETSP1065-20121228/6298_1 /TAXON_ID=265537 /ORGANISM="Amphiprora paludosa, Strain CCMP125" /LENGTH=1109 /DNA_ID=CAMNT_0013197981 /DNA_START=226 /DNA_END=3555 /DNA_ORIENTATION=-
MSKKFFRPPANAFQDSESEDEDEEELSDEEDDDQQKSKSKPTQNNANLSSSDDDDDDDDEDDDDDDDDDDDRGKRTKRKAPAASEPRSKRPKASSFFDMEAEASDDEEEEEEEVKGRGSGGARGDDAGEQMDREALEIMKLQDRRRAQAGGAFMERTAAEMAADIEARHRSQRRPMNHSRIRSEVQPAARPSGGGAGRGGASAAAAAEPAVEQRHHAPMEADEEGGPEVYTAVAQQGLVPSVSDPSFWMVSCPTGKEQEMVMQIMNKAVAMARQQKPLGITGVIAAQSKGKIFVEGFNEPAIMEAIQNVRGLMQYTMRLVPIGDMTTVMTVTPSKKPVRKNEWVRMTRGHYKGDLALVKEVQDSGLKCIIQCVPRLDLTLSDLPPEEARIRRKTVRPPQKFFSPQELKAMGKHGALRQLYPGSASMGYCYMYEGSYYKDGYLIKEMTVGSMVKPCTDDDPPTLEELQGFQRRKGASNRDEDEDDEDGDENEGSKLAGSLLDELAELQKKTGFDKSQKASGGLLIGDTVEVIEGDLIGVQGKIVSLDGSTVKVQPNDPNVTDEIEFLASQVRKYIAMGSHVKVTDGRYANETGTVVAVEQMDGAQDFTAVVLTDITNKEITVRISQLRESAETTTGQDKLQGYELYDLVVLSGGGSANEVGVIVRVGREDFTVINNHGIAREARPEELRGKRNAMSQRAVALDVQGNQLRSGDTVNVVEGRHKGKAATVKRMNRSQLFLHSQTRSEHAGVFVVKSRSCVLAGSRSQSRPGAGDGGATPWTPQSHQTGRPGAGRKRDDGLIGKTVRIQAGNWKGFIGTVSDTTGTHVEVELHARLKKVTVTHERVHVIGDKFGATENQTSNPAVNPQVMAPTTPFVAAGQTPMHGGATPMHGAGLESENSDEVWRPGGSIDQDNTDSAAKENNDGWGSTSNTNNDQDGDDNDGWGSTSNSQNADSGWGAPPPAPADAAPTESSTDNVAPAASAASFKQEPVKREQATEMEHDLADGEERPGWLMERVCVTVKSQNDKKGHVKEIHGGMVVVESGDGSTESISMDKLSMVAPVEHDPVLVTGGNEVGLEGTLVCIDGTDAILKDANDAFKIVDFSFLAKVKA